MEKGPDDIAFQHDGLLDETRCLEIEAALHSGYDTTLGTEHKTFDNILFDSGSFRLKKEGVYRFDKKPEVLGESYDNNISDHYPVWAIFKIPRFDDDKLAE